MTLEGKFFVCFSYFKLNAGNFLFVTYLTSQGDISFFFDTAMLAILRQKLAYLAGSGKW